MKMSVSFTHLGLS